MLKQKPFIPSLYRDPYQYELLASMTAPADLPFYQEQLKTARRSLLELGCGTGRLSRFLALSGTEVTGLEISDALLEWARSQTHGKRLQIEWLLGDMRNFDLQRHFGLILLPYNTINHLYELQDLRSCLEAVVRHMDKDSRFIIDTFNPDPNKLSMLEQPEPKKILEYIDPKSQLRTHLFEQTRYDAATQINLITLSYEVAGNQTTRIDELTMRVYFPQELDWLLQLSGLEIEAKLGDYDGSVFTSSSSHQIVLCRKALS